MHICRAPALPTTSRGYKDITCDAPAAPGTLTASPDYIHTLKSPCDRDGRTPVIARTRTPQALQRRRRRRRRPRRGRPGCGAPRCSGWSTLAPSSRSLRPLRALARRYRESGCERRRWREARSSRRDHSRRRPREGLASRGVGRHEARRAAAPRTGRIDARCRRTACARERGVGGAQHGECHRQPDAPAQLLSRLPPSLPSSGRPSGPLLRRACATRTVSASWKASVGARRRAPIR